jgi:anti-sigma B factor antagonist
MTEKTRTAEIPREKIEFLNVGLEEVGRIPRCVVVALKGYIDTYNSPGFQRQINNVITAGYIRLIFDFAGVTYISSTGIGVFTNILKDVKSRHGDIALAGVADRVFEVFQLLGFSRFFNIVSTLEEAVEWMAVRGRQSTGEVFPGIIACPVCSKKLRASRAGRFRCGECRTILVIDVSGRAAIG